MSDEPLLRPITPADHALVLDWNLRHVELLAPMDADRLELLLGFVDAGSIITHAGADVGFVLTFLPGAPYDSANFRWFVERYPVFLYLDRIVIDPAARRTGIASRVYAEIEARAAELGPLLCLEVNVDPPNEPSLAFHRSRGFTEVGRYGPDGHAVSMLVKETRETG
ncbi:MAG: family N-acetyltransferase [Marmoricola sp.]|nr:family N-acetyltransferase [Marmoricola sp.]